jgi:two-component sensor histidine kinase
MLRKLNVMQRFLNILAWRSRQPPLGRWGAAVFLSLLALLVRLGLGGLHGANPALAFYPAILLAAVFLGWREATLVLGLSVAAGIYLFLSPGLYLLPIGWTAIGGLNIGIITALIAAAEELAAANERQRILFQEAQHRVANTLQAVVSTLEIARRRIASSPEEAARLLEEAIQRFIASGDVHRRLSDPKLFRRALGSILQDAVFTVIDNQTVNLLFDIEELDLSFDQMSTITMLVIEIANNAQKHVFQGGHGSMFSVSLKALPDRRAMLAIRDDGPGMAPFADAGPTENRLGLRIVRGLVNELFGTFSVTPGKGTQVVVEFPVSR